MDLLVVAWLLMGSGVYAFVFIFFPQVLPVGLC